MVEVVGAALAPIIPKVVPVALVVLCLAGPSWFIAFAAKAFFWPKVLEEVSGKVWCKLRLDSPLGCWFGGFHICVMPCGTSVRVWIEVSRKDYESIEEGAVIVVHIPRDIMHLQKIE